MRYELLSMVSIWVLALIFGTCIEAFAERAVRPTWYLIAVGVSVLVSFVVQLMVGQQHRFIARVAGGVIGAIVLLGAVSSVMWALRLVSAT